MADLTTDVARGDRLSAAAENLKVRAIRRNRPLAGHGLRARVTRAGTILSLQPGLVDWDHPWRCELAGQDSVRITGSTMHGVPATLPDGSVLRAGEHGYVRWARLRLIGLLLTFEPGRPARLVGVRVEQRASVDRLGARQAWRTLAECRPAVGDPSGPPARIFSLVHHPQDFLVLGDTERWRGIRVHFYAAG